MNPAKLIPFFLLVLFSFSAFATHNRAAELSYRFTGSNTIAATITTYTNASAVAADRDSLPINWGDGVTELLVRNNGNGQELTNNYKLNIYQGTHTYASPPDSGFVVVSMTDPNRNSDIINIAGGNSINVEFYVEDTIWFAGQGVNNNGPILLYPPIDYAFVGDTFYHNPAAYDVEADSLTFELSIPLQAQGVIVPGYVNPSVIPSAGAPNNVLSVDRLTGELMWASPQESGIYNIAILIHEYRYGTLLSTMTRDMVIIVLSDTTAPSHLSGSFTDTVIAPGTVFSLAYGGVADAGYTDSLSAYSGIFEFASGPALFTAGSPAVSVSGDLTWTPGHNQYKQRETRIVAVRSQQQSANLPSNIRAFRVTVVDTANTNTAVTEVPDQSNIFVYPVPAIDRLHINATLPASTMISDMIGRDYVAKISEREVDISDLPIGIYLLRWQNGGKTFSRRFIKE